eukprot:TRINITY_DN5862_c0_g1_i2.p1 TRINITY_DN5862_c0_g1~~TRINITY_DN5862_c0_g1_i2.p1  ORF type:complete len:850 (+),score=321.86 TRINITY_DN5862_c0_g1_i2:69-2552(+)
MREEEKDVLLQKEVESNSRQWINEIGRGQFEKIIENESMREKISKILSVWNQKRNEGEKSQNESSNQLEMDASNQWDQMVLGIASLFLFIQSNWTGPPLSIHLRDENLFQSNNNENDREKSGEREGEEERASQWKGLFSLIEKGKLSECMEVDGEPIYSKTKSTPFLLIAHEILVKRIDELSEFKTSARWWALRLLYKYQSLFANETNSIRELFIKYSNELLELEEIKGDEELFARLNLEIGLFWNSDRNNTKSRKFFLTAQETSGLTVNLTGAYGVRTKFQSFQTPQLILEAKSNRKIKETSAEEKAVPQSISQEDETYLDKPKLTEAKENDNLNPIDQSIILSLCLNVKNQNPQHGLTTEEMMPYVERVLEHPNDWMIHSEALYLKSRIQSSNDRLKERAALQLQVLVDQFSDATLTVQKEGEKEPTIPQRCKYIFVIAYPSFWELKRELGARFLEMGAAATALQIFEELEMWDEIIECYQIMGKNQKAESVIREQLSIKETPLLWCVLGDVTGEESCYEKSWELSGKHFARAKRAQARLCTKRNDWKGAIENFEIALAINPLFSNAWFTIGCAYMRSTEWQKSVVAFQRCVQISPGEGEAWNNMASSLVELGKKREAFYPLQEALKCLRTNWRIWQNYLYICMDLKEFQQAIIAIKEILELNEAEPIDSEILRVLCKAVSTNVIDSNGVGAMQSTKTALENLLQFISSKVSNDPALWKIFAEYHMDIGESKKVIEFLEKQVRAAKKPSWEIDETIFKEYASAVEALVEAYLAEKSSTSLFAAKSLLTSILKDQTVQDHYQFSETYHNLENLKEKVLQVAASIKK